MIVAREEGVYDHRALATDAIRPSDDLRSNVRVHVVVQDDVCRGLQIDTGGAVKIRNENNFDASFVEAFHFFRACACGSRNDAPWHDKSVEEALDHTVAADVLRRDDEASFGCFVETIEHDFLDGFEFRFRSRDSFLGFLAFVDLLGDGDELARVDDTTTVRTRLVRRAPGQQACRAEEMATRGLDDRIFDGVHADRAVIVAGDRLEARHGVFEDANSRCPFCDFSTADF